MDYQPLKTCVPCSVQSSLPSNSNTMGKNYRSPAKIKRNILRLLNFKKDYLEDCWGTEIDVDNVNNEIIWNASKVLKLTLKQNTKIIETRGIYNPSYPSMSVSEKLQLFQSMWKPDHNFFNFFSCMHHHLRSNSSKCDNFCGGFSFPYCGYLAYFLSTNTWPKEYQLA